MKLDLIEGINKPGKAINVQKYPDEFYRDVIAGLTMEAKRLPSKYFYDKAGDRIFQEIMQCPEYYLTACEMDIFRNQSDKLVEQIKNENKAIDVIELGPGDCAKSVHLLHALQQAGIKFTYVPVDISANIIAQLQHSLPQILPGITVKGIVADYYLGLPQAADPRTQRRKIILCLGGNTGNMTIENSHAFYKRLRMGLEPGDRTIIGFDLVKHPAIIRAAYDDKQGITSRFNLNLLKRMNRELQTDFNTSKFEHYCCYEPATGACKSWLVCLEDMKVRFRDITISFTRHESIWMEISQKYTMEQVSAFAQRNGFRQLKCLLDSKKWFTDAVWEAI